MSECVIVNPAAGRGQARRLIARLARREPVIAIWQTGDRGHAVGLAEQAVAAGYKTIIAAGGDGTVHEAANGLLRSGRTDVTLGVWPIGSANDYAFALGVKGDWPLKPRLRNRLSALPVDVGRVTAGGRVRYFINGLGIGFNGAVTYEAQRIHGLRGVALYGLAFLKAVVRHFDSPSTMISIDGKGRQMRTLAFSVNIGKREGNFVVTPRAVLDDGFFDYVHAGPMSRWHALTMLPRLAIGNLPPDHPMIRQGRCREVRIRSEVPLWIHTDGELFAQPADKVTEVTIELLPSALRVLRRP